MAFLDKLSDAAAAIGDKAGEAVEITKIKTKISGEKRGIENEMTALGKLFYEKAKAGEALQIADAEEIISTIDEHYAAIEQLEEDLRNVK